MSVTLFQISKSIDHEDAIIIRGEERIQTSYSPRIQFEILDTGILVTYQGSEFFYDNDEGFSGGAEMLPLLHTRQAFAIARRLEYAD